MKLQKDIRTVCFEATFNLISDLVKKKNVYVNIPIFNIENQNALLSKNKLGGFDLNIEFNVKFFNCLLKNEAVNIELLIGENRCDISIFTLQKQTILIM